MCDENFSSPTSSLGSITSRDTDNDDDHTDHLSNKLHFTCILTEQEYKSFDTQNRHIKRLDKSNSKSAHKSRNRLITWNKTIWTYVLNRKILSTTNLSCIFIFKRHKITECGPVYARISAYCKQCNCQLRGTILDHPQSNKEVKVELTLTGNYTITHSAQIKRPFSGLPRNETTRKMIHEGYSASNIRNTMANELMQCGDNEPSDLPRLGSLRTALFQAVKNDCLHLYVDSYF